MCIGGESMVNVKILDEFIENLESYKKYILNRLEDDLEFNEEFNEELLHEDLLDILNMLYFK